MNTLFSTTSEQYKPILKRWILRVLYDLKAYTQMNTRYGLEEYEEVLNYIGIGYLINRYEDRRLSKKKLRKIIKPIIEKHEALGDLDQGALFDNTEKLGDLIGMNPIEKKLLSFAVMLNTAGVLEKATDLLGSISSPGIINVFSVLLKISTANIRESIEKDGLLHRTGLMRISHGNNEDLVYKLSIMNDISAVLLDDTQPNIMKSLTRFFSPSKPANLTVDDFSHISTDFQLVHRYLKAASSKHKRGINLLIYGVPGTGKTELVRTLAASLKMKLYDVAVDVETSGTIYEDEERSRVDSYRLCQQVLKRKDNTLILFDEIEDAFIRDGIMERFGMRTSTDAQKGSFNHLLESNPLPTIWVSNIISHIDEAIIRRFDIILELKIPPQSTRIRIIKKHTADINVSEKWVEKISINESLAPALISRAVNVVKELNDTEEALVEANMERILKSTLSAMGYDKNLNNPHMSVLTYRLDALNPDYDLANLQKALQVIPQGSFCLYGPSGTGKSEFAHQLAKVIDKPLLIKRASDLLDPYVGMTERNIANMFEQATEDDALLLLDEADSFLRDRTRARESWEVAQVNELLTQMESFKGLFFCTTNLVEVLDQASLRRFDLKIKFDYLKPEQAWKLFEQTLADYQEAGNTLDGSWEQTVKGLQGLTPGDFATVARQNKFSLTPMAPERLYEALGREVKFKKYGTFKEIGFMPHQTKE